MRNRGIAQRIPNLYNTIHISALVQSLCYPVGKKMCAQSSIEALTDGSIPQCDKSKLILLQSIASHFTH